MKAILKTITAPLGVMVIGVILTVAANAECGDIQRTKPGASLQPQSWQGIDRSGQASLLQISNDNDNDAIVGFWQVTLTAQGNPGPPDGTVIDKGFSQWHSDGTEILNSSRAPVTGSYCMGVWKKVGRGHYKLNHFALSWDENNNFVGVANIREEVVVSRDGKNYAGTFTLNQYDQAGNTLAHVIGTVNATRITVDTPTGNVL
ncbi:MAG: hypothetical protein LAO56_20330 [Acidobacteriia bacterium]|nr:hypothetical protein [Terriglobia bacterium]